VSLSSHPLAEFRERYDALPRAIQDVLFAANPYHSYLRFKEVGAYWSVPVRGDTAPWPDAETIIFIGSGSAATRNTSGF